MIYICNFTFSSHCNLLFYASALSMNLRNHKRLTRSSPPDARRRDASLTAWRQRQLRIQGPKDPLAPPASRFRGSSGLLSSRSTENSRSRRILRSDSNFKVLAKAKRARFSKRRVKRNFQADRTFTSSVSVKHCGSRLQECSICVEMKGKSVSDRINDRSSNAE